MKKLLQISFIFIVIVSSATILNSCRKFTKTSSGLSSSDDDVAALNCPCNDLKCWEEKTSQVTKAAGECLSETIDIAGPKALEKGLKYINVALEMKGIFQHLKVYTVILDTVRKGGFTSAVTSNLKQLGKVSECEGEGSKALNDIAKILDKFAPIFTSSSDTQVVE